MKYALLTALILAASTVHAERDSLIKYDDEWNLFSKFDLGYTEVDGDSGAQFGVAVGGLLNDRLALGLAARTLANSVQTESPFLNDIENTDFWYGGFYTEYVFNPDSLVYMSLDLLVGGGNLDLKRVSGLQDRNSFFALEPGVNVMVNVTESFHLGLGLHYRFIDGVDSEDINDSDLSGATASIFLRFTEF